MVNKIENDGYALTVVTIDRNRSITEAARLMRSSGVGCLIVTDGSGNLAGIVTERDITCRAAADLLDIEKSNVSQIMTSKVICCNPDTEPRKAREIMASHHIRHLPIVENSKVTGIYSLRDIVQEQLVEARFAAEQIAMLSACLKSTNFIELTDMIISEVPKLFGAKRCLFYFHQPLAMPEKQACYRASHCLYPPELFVQTLSGTTEKCSICPDCTPTECSDKGAVPPRLVIPLEINKTNMLSPQDIQSEKGFLCMCGLDDVKNVSSSLLHYKVKLIKDILNIHIANIIQYQDAKSASITDSLTQIGSRKYFEEMLEAESGRLDRYDRSFSIAILDVDNFKKVNDKFGHIAGDSILKKLADCMNSQKRTCDILARFGGDEFVFILPETTSQEAVSMMDRIQKKIRQISAGENYFITVSCGIVNTIPNQTIISTELIHKADTALYHAKQAGKDCIKIWKEGSSVPKKEEINILYG